ncbi:MAG: YggT family protein [Actinomycetales bacterium]
MINVTGWIVFALNVFLLALFARLVLDYVRMFRPGWRPRGILLPLAEIIYSLTDKPLSFVRKFIPPLRMGPVALDLSFIVLFFAISIIAGALS